jgi:Ca2+-binding RTX toxin-like protein
MAFIPGTANNDDFTGTEFSDYITGEAGDDILRGADGNDILFAGAGADGVSGGEGSDFIYGQDGIDKLDGDNGNDYMEGGNGNDFITGGTGDDTLLGGEGDDSIVGDFGNDYLFGGSGQDSFGLGLTADIIVTAVGSGTSQSSNDSSPAFGIDFIYDFQIGVDKIVLSPGFALNNGAADIAFVANDAAAATSSGRIVYSRGTGNLFFNRNEAGSGFGERAGQIATILGAPNLSASDFAPNSFVPFV